MKTLRIKFENSNGEQLSGRLELPLIGKPRSYAIFAHCFTCTKNLTAVGNISRALTQQGIAVLRFDFTGLGQSDGEFENTNFSSNVQDLIAAADYLKAEHDAPQLLIGHSLGGAAVLMAASELASVKAVATIGAPAEPEHVKHLIQPGIPEIEQKGEAQVSIGGRPFTIKKHFLEDLEKNLLSKVIPELEAAVLILHSPQDRTVGIDNASAIFNAAKHPRSFVSLDGADHLLTDSDDSTYAGEVIGSWSGRYVVSREEVQNTEHGSVLVRTTDSYTTEITTAHHQLLADEPKSVGGNNLGPTPYGYLLASLGSCIGITLRMYIDRKGWEVDEINVHLHHEKIHAEDCDDCESEKGLVDLISVKLEFLGNVDDSQKARLMEIAGKCPVHKTLLTETKIEKTLLN
jgi:putative redox protein